MGYGGEMKILVACEFSGIVREAFKKRGHDSWSCDLLPTEIPGQHIQDDVLKHLDEGLDLMIAHPPCTYLSIAGYHYSAKDTKRMRKTFEAMEFVKVLFNSPISKVCIENPVSMISTFWRKPDQIVQPCYFGEAEIKTTCLWLKGLSPLMHKTMIEVKPNGGVIRKSGQKAGQKYNYYWRQGKTAKNRSRTFQGIADAMAEQWG